MHYLLTEDIVIEASLSFGAELDLAFLHGEEGIVLADADIIARQYRSAALADDDLAGRDMLAMVDLDPQMLWIRIAAVFGCSCSFFMCH